MILVDKVQAKYLPLKEGTNADYIPILTETPSDLFDVVIVTREGEVYAGAIAAVSQVQASSE